MASEKVANGIREWPGKRKALEIIFCAYTPKELVRIILPNIPGGRETKTFIDSMYKWDLHKPLRGEWQTLFVSNLVKQLIVRSPDLAGHEHRVKTVLFDGSLDDFTALFPENIRKLIAVPAKTQDESIKWGDFTRTLSRRFPPLDSIRSALNTGRIDQKWHYLTPVAEENWKAVLVSGVYEQYEECKVALKKLCREEGIWLDFFRKGEADGIVMLGCGSGSKNAILIRSMATLSPHPKLFYSLVDFSPFMLDAARVEVEILMETDQLTGRVRLTTHKFDFVDDFRGVGASMCRPEYNVAWMLPGGTLGNLDEKSFFESLARESKAGDLLVIGVETVGAGDKVEDAELKRKYNSPQVRRFVEMPFRSLLFAERVEGPYPEIEVEVVHGYKRGHSKIEGSKTVEVSSEIRGKKIVLLTSTRYEENALLEFAQRARFEKETIVASPDNARYKQFVFRKK